MSGCYQVVPAAERMRAFYRFAQAPLAALLGAVLILGGLAGCARAPKLPPEVTAAMPRPVENPFSKALEQIQADALVGGAAKPAADMTYQISPHDVLEISVFNEASMNASTRVDADGCINFPPVGQVRAADLGERQLEELLENKLRGRYIKEPHVSVFVREMHPREVAIVGQVKAPGRFPHYSAQTLVELLARAGGTTDKAGGKAYITRFEKPQWMNAGGLPSTSTLALASAGNQAAIQKMTIDLNELLVHGNQSLNVALKPWDIVNIPDAGFVHITGKGIEKPGVYALRSTPNTLEQLIDDAGGLKFEADKNLYIVRETGQGQPGRTEQVNYKKLLKQGNQEVLLSAGDKVIVGRTATKTFFASIGRGIAGVFRASMYMSIPMGG